jgi:hypothetical protein
LKKTKRQNTLYVPCESHGLQLLIKDILDTHPYSKILEKSQSVASFFHCAKRQYAILREEQQRLYGRHYALVLSVITWWGTQQALMSALLRNKSVLQAYLERRADIDCPHDITAVIRDSTFWSTLDDLLTLIREISEEQKQSETSLKAHGGLAQVFDRWHTLSVMNRPESPSFDALVSLALHLVSLALRLVSALLALTLGLLGLALTVILLLALAFVFVWFYLCTGYGTPPVGVPPRAHSALSITQDHSLAGITPGGGLSVFLPRGEVLADASI